MLKALSWVKRTWSANAGAVAAVGFLLIAAVFGVVAGIQRVALDSRHFHIEWGTPFEAFAAVGTVGTLGFSVWSWARLRQEAVEDKRRGQARRIAAWLGPGHFPREWVVRVVNNSEEPVTEAAIYLVWVQGGGYHTGEDAERLYTAQTEELVRRGISRPPAIGYVRALVQIIPPDKGTVRFGGPIRSDDPHPPQGVVGVEIAFTDASGHHWVRRASGELNELKSDALSHYGISRPVNYVRLEPWVNE